MRDSYELLDGRRIEGLHRDDVIAAFLTFRTYEPRMLRPGVDDEALDAMALALAAAGASRRRRARQADLRMFRIAEAAHSRALLETHRRVLARSSSGYCYTCQRPAPPGSTSALCGGCGGYLSPERAS